MSQEGALCCRLSSSHLDSDLKAPPNTQFPILRWAWPWFALLKASWSMCFCRMRAMLTCWTSCRLVTSQTCDKPGHLHTVKFQTFTVGPETVYMKLIVGKLVKHFPNKIHWSWTFAETQTIEARVSDFLEPTLSWAWAEVMFHGRSLTCFFGCLWLNESKLAFVSTWHFREIKHVKHVCQTVCRVSPSGGVSGFSKETTRAKHKSLPKRARSHRKEIETSQNKQILEVVSSPGKGSKIWFENFWMSFLRNCFMSLRIFKV